MLTYEQVVKRLKEIKDMGYVRTHRAGDTGIGKTLEDLLGIHENNIPGPDAQQIELKAARKGSKSMITLFTKSPMPKNANTILLRRYGYPSARGNRRKELHTTVNAVSFNSLKGEPGFKIEVRSDRIECVDSEHTVVGYWTYETLQKVLERKLPKLMYVKADSRGRGRDEEFWFNEAFLLSGYDFESFMELLKAGKILVDIRIGQYPDGRTHDHGTAFRMFEADFELLFEERVRVI